MNTRESQSPIRAYAFLAASVVIFGVLFFRLFNLQIVQGVDYRKKSDDNRFRLIELSAPRGVMRDRFGDLLITNKPSYSCYAVPREIWKDEEGMDQICETLQIPEDEFREALRPYRNSFRPMRVRRDLSFAALSSFEELRDQIPGAFLEIEPKRFHPDGLAPHMAGYISEISESELPRFPGLKSGDLVGKRGLERVYDEALRGVKGRRFSIVNVHGQESEEPGSIEQVAPQPGSELWLTIDRHAQIVAESLLVDKIGAIVAMDIRTGGVLVMASAPRYSPDIFSGAIRSEDWSALLADSTKPMLNRAVQTMYPPGSTIKMAMLIEALSSGTISPDFTISCPGHYTVGNRTFKCWKKGGHGTINCRKAVEQSCDVFFYKVGMMLGVDGIRDALQRFHFGSQTGIDMTSEAAGLVPSSDYYNERYGPSGWTRGFFPSIAIGQGEVLTTPLQMCAYAAALADGRYWRKPYLVQSLHNPITGETIQVNNSEAIPLANMSESAMEMARDGMELVVWGDFGTARAQRDTLVRIAGKTGTAQNSHGDDHAWFVGYGPIENPTYACCALVEFGEHGSSAAAPIVKEVLKALVLADREELALSMADSQTQ